jgi:hypothetical protein
MLDLQDMLTNDKHPQFLISNDSERSFSNFDSRLAKVFEECVLSDKRFEVCNKVKVTFSRHFLQ